MMSFLYCCSVEKLEVISYEDQSQLFLEVFEDGSGKITKAVLNPLVKFKDEIEESFLHSLHQKASRLCFIANSCNFAIDLNPNFK